MTIRIEDFIEQTNNAATVDELFALYRTVMADVGYDRLIFSLMTNHDVIGRAAGHGIMLNYPEDWMKHYGEKNYEVTDPVRQKICAAMGVFYWDDLHKSMNLNKTQKETLHGGEEAGLHDGIGISLRGPMGAIAGIGAASSTGGVERDKNTTSYINLISQQFYAAYIALEEKPRDVMNVHLSDREQEIMTWCARGKTKPEIAEIMNLSVHTVKFHLRNAYEKLGTHNDRYAILKALHLGIIQL